MVRKGFLEEVTFELSSLKYVGISSEGTDCGIEYESLHLVVS